MARRWADSVRTTTSSTGTGSLTTGAAFDTATQSFAEAVAAGSINWGDEVEIAVTDGVDREVSRATLADDGANGRLDSRSLLFSSTGALINWPAGVKHIRLTRTADDANENSNNELTQHFLPVKAASSWADSVIRQDAAGNLIGIGAAPVAAKLELTTSAAEQLRLVDDVGNSEMRIKHTKVGSAVKSQIDPYFSSGGHNVQLRLFEESNAAAQHGFLELCDPGTTTVQTRLASGSGLDSWIDNDGFFGIGTATPLHQLHVQSAFSPSLGVEDTTTPVKALVVADNSLTKFGSNTNHPLTLITNNVERARVDANGQAMFGGTAADTIIDYTSTTNQMLHCYDGTSSAFLVSQGNPAYVILADLGGTIDSRMWGLVCDASRLGFNALNDDATAKYQNCLSISNGSGKLGIGGNNGGTSRVWVQNGRLQIDNNEEIMCLQTDNMSGFSFKCDASDNAQVRVDGTLALQFAQADRILDFRMSMSNSAKDPTTDSPADWVEIKIAGTTYYLPAYAA